MVQYYIIVYLLHDEAGARGPGPRVRGVPRHDVHEGVDLGRGDETVGSILIVSSLLYH